MPTHTAPSWIRNKKTRLGRFGLVVWAGFFLACLAGCASPRPAGSSATELAGRLRSLRPGVAPEEAVLAAEKAHSYSLELAQEYRAVRPAVLHNVLVNMGLKKRGLCFQWAEDLSAKVQSLDLRTLETHRGVARLETPREHSSVVLTARGQPFDEGIVLDAWRHSGRLHWCGVKEDRYPWIEVLVVTNAEVQPPALRKSRR